MKSTTHNAAPSRSAALKVGGAVALVLALTLTPVSRPWWIAAEAVLVVASVAFCRAGLVPLLRRVLLLSPFVAGVALASAFSAHGSDWRILAVRSSLCLTTVIVLSQTVTIAELLSVLRSARVPALLLTTLALMHRYLFVLADESARMGKARSARTFSSRRRFAWITAASVVGHLFVRATERAERVYDAMCARGWKA